MTIDRRLLVSCVWLLLVALGAGAGVAVHRLWDLRNEIERLAERLTLEIGPESTLLYDAEDQVMSAVYEEHRIGVPLDAVAPHLVHAVLVTEDRRFYEHGGIDLLRVVRAGLANVRAGEIVQGGSTVTQQLVRSILLDREKTYLRKFKEAVLARRLEERYSKRAILEAYLNRVYFGDGYYGVEAASRGYFGKHALDVDLTEAAMLAGLIKGPSLYSPSRAPELAHPRRDLVLRQMRDEGVISADQYQQAAATPVQALLAGHEGPRPDLRRARGGEYFRSAVLRELVERFGETAVYTGGLRVYTTLDRRLQAAAEAAIRSHVQTLTRGDRDAPQGALVALDPRTGEVKALVGGRDFDESPFNRAIDARRQPGSAFKPFVFAMALESGYGLGTWLEGLDEPILTSQGPWLPGGEHERTAVQLREALVISSNRAAAHLLQEVGVGPTLEFVQRFGIRSPLPEVASLALGTGEVSLFELTSAYGVFANGGLWRAPRLIRRVEDREGRALYQAPDAERRVVSDATAYLMSSMMADVIDRGTASTARRAGFRLRAAGKTGTSQAYADAWFVGYTPRLVTGVWFGHDTPQTIMKRGFAGVVAVPAWARFMAGAHEGVETGWFERPGSVVGVRVCRLSGLRATERCDLPVVEPARFDPDVGFMPSETREGGTYVEMRHAARVPEVCLLPHGEAVPVPAWSDLVETAGAPPAPPVPSVRATGAGIVLSGSPAPVPPSLRPPAAPAVITIDPARPAVPPLPRSPGQ